MNISIPWNQESTKTYELSRKSHNDVINNNLPILNNLVEQEARNVSGAAQRRREARGAVDLALNSLKALPNQIDGVIRSIDIGGLENAIKTTDERITEEKSKQKKSEELLAIRKEQSETLAKKYSANLHSSWLGLWRPLKENTHVGLNVASVAFGIIAAVFIGFFAYSYFSSPASGGGAGDIATNVRNAGNVFATGLIGGFRKVKRAIN
jgi:hypothetical protein